MTHQPGVYVPLRALFLVFMFFGSEKSLFFIAGQIKNFLMPKLIFSQINKLIFNQIVR